jgi:hypothetical protein
VLASNVHVRGSGATREPDRCCGRQWGPLGSRSALVVVVSHFLELEADLDVLRFGRIVGLIDDEVDALWSHVCVAADSLVSHVPSSVARNPPDGLRE